MELDDIRRRIEREKRIIDETFWFTAGPVNNDDFHWEARMMGPMNSPYADHFFKLIIHFGLNFPLSPQLVASNLMAEPNVNAPHPSSTQALQLYLDDHNRYNGKLGNEILELLECSDTGKRDSRMQRYWDANEFEEDQEKNISIV
ncbi:hypothetical protein BUALT_Bualt11G0066400 [Buddleja alternifolia]|uniref:UBC core domain-containing protein n=1 Tax=Buddleja alternifolia TaxID=168488 RepID=A0AAV6X134_9LAMI|nr:hypothetical protein BUALT_Bualt11G0066400 [Buddleja alternifolia]